MRCGDPDDPMLPEEGTVTQKEISSPRPSNEDKLRVHATLFEYGTSSASAGHGLRRGGGRGRGRGGGTSSPPNPSPEESECSLMKSSASELITIPNSNLNEKTENTRVRTKGNRTVKNTVFSYGITKRNAPIKPSQLTETTTKFTYIMGVHHDLRDENIENVNIREKAALLLGRFFIAGAEVVTFDEEKDPINEAPNLPEGKTNMGSYIRDAHISNAKNLHLYLQNEIP